MATTKKRPVDRNRRSARKKKKANLKFALLVLFAACILTLAIFIAVNSAQKQLNAPRPTEEPVIRTVIDELSQHNNASDPADAEAKNFWPSEAFPSVPVYQASRYTTTLDGMRAEIVIPAEDAQGLNAYMDQLTEAGASLLVKSDDFNVLLHAGTEIHVSPNGARPTISLFGEPSISYKGIASMDVILPASGKLVAASESEDGQRVRLTYRNAAISDALQYINQLRNSGFSLTRRLTLRNNTLTGALQKGGVSVTVDYFTKNEYLITWNALEEDAPAGEEAPVDETAAPTPLPAEATPLPSESEGDS